MQGKQILLTSLRCPVLTDCNVNSAHAGSVKYQQYFMTSQPFTVRKSQHAEHQLVLNTQVRWYTPFVFYTTLFCYPRELCNDGPLKCSMCRPKRICSCTNKMEIKKIGTGDSDTSTLQQSQLQVWVRPGERFLTWNYVKILLRRLSHLPSKPSMRTCNSQL